jgi:molybdopterin adenylyltransferase
MIRIGIITVSDRSFAGKREDLSGPEINKWAAGKGYGVIQTMIVPDEIDDIKNAINDLIMMGANLVLTTGGTGFAPRDVTPEATLQVIERQAPGFCETMRHRSLEITSHAMLSRAVSGIKAKTLIINLPGSPKAVRENLSYIENAIPHAIELLESMISDCGTQ